MLAELDGLRHVVFGQSEVLGSQATDGISLLVFHNDGLDDELHLDRHGVVILSAGRAILADLLRSG
jgi:hypothetical protein